MNLILKELCNQLNVYLLWIQFFSNYGTSPMYINCKFHFFSNSGTSPMYLLWIQFFSNSGTSLMFIPACMTLTIRTIPKNMFWQGERGHLSVNYTGNRSFITQLYYLLAQKLWAFERFPIWSAQTFQSISGYRRAIFVNQHWVRTSIYRSLSY